MAGSPTAAKLGRPALRPPAPRLVVPNGAAMSSFGERGQGLTAENLREQQARFHRMRPHVERFFALLSEGRILADTLSVTTNRSFMDQALERVAREASLRNRMAEILHGHHTRWQSFSVYLPWVTIFADYFTKTPIPANLADTAIAQGSLAAIKAVLEADRGFFGGVRQGVTAPKIEGNKLRLAGIEVTALYGDRIVTPRMISADSTTIEHEGRTYYNGLPGDRGRFPSLVIPQGEPISFSIRNTTTDRFYAVVPTINGIPLRVANLGFLFDGFLNSPFPLIRIAPQTTYIKPGGEVTFDSFKVDRAGIINGESDFTYLSKIGDIGFDTYANELAHLMGAEFDRQMAEETRRLFGQEPSDPKDAELRAMVLHQSRYAWMHHLLKFLEDAKEADIFMSKPVIADGLTSNELNNPFLGSLGITVIEVTRPPVQARHDHGHSSVILRGGDSLTRGGGMMGVGGMGLGTISGGADRAAERADFWESYQYDDMNHTFTGILTANFLSTTNG